MQGRGHVHISDLAELHALYLAYTAEMAADRVENYPSRDLEDFATWWQSLSGEVQATCEQNYRRGYARVVDDGREQIHDIVSKARS